MSEPIAELGQAAAWETKTYRSLRVLLHIEWILLGIAVLALLTQGLPGDAIPRRLPPPPTRGLPGLALLCIVVLGGLGWRLPPARQGLPVIYIGVSLGLCWLSVFFGSLSPSTFAALLLIVVIRACILFPWRGRLVVAAGAYGSFLLLLLLRFQALLLRVNQRLVINRPRPHNIPPEVVNDWIQGFLRQLSINSALLFGLVLAFVVLLVGTVLAESESRQALSAANQQLRRYALLIENQATLQERSRIAREMHDSVGHSLTAQSIQLENAALCGQHQDWAQLQHHLSEARRLGKTALQDVRQSVATLRTDPLQGRSLAAALEQLIQDFQQMSQIQVTLQGLEPIALAPETALAIYRVIQEALTNIARHSGASRAAIRFATAAGQLHLQIKDNGQGFDPQVNTTGFGLRSLQERVQALGGQLHLRSQPGQGCQIRIVVPLP